MRPLLAAAVGALLAGCATLEGGWVVPGKTTAKEVEARMGAPSARIPRAGGEATLYYPGARQNHAVAIGADGVVRAIEPRLTKANFARLVPGETTEAQVRELLGPPEQAARMARLQRQVLEYRFQHYEELRILWVQLSDDGKVREVLDMLDWSAYPQDGSPFQ